MSHHLNAVRAAFSAQAADFSRPGLTVTDPHHLGWMLASLELDPAWSVLDVAAGTGLLSLAIAPQVRQVLALDATPAMIREGTRAVAAAGPTRITFVNGLAENLPAAAGAFDLVACRFAIHHFKDPRRPVSDMLRVCRAGGRIALVDLIASDDTRLAQSYNHFERLRDPSHTRALPQIELEALLGDCGLMLTPTTLRSIPVDVERWLGLTKTDERNRELIHAGLQAELRGETTTGLRPFIRDEVLYFRQTWAITIVTKPA